MFGVMVAFWRLKAGGIGSSPNNIDQKENLLKVFNMKKQMSKDGLLSLL